MSYKRYLFETGGYRAYEYARTDDATVDDAAFSEIHNALRRASATIVGIEIATAAMFRAGARTALAGSAAPNANSIASASAGTNWDHDNPVYVAANFAKTPFVGLRKDGADSIILQSRPLNVKLTINPFDKGQERLLQQLFPGYSHPTEYERTGSGHNSKPVATFSDISADVDQALLMKLLTGTYSDYVPEVASASPEFTAVAKLPKGMGISLSMKLRPHVNNRMVGLTFSDEMGSGAAIMPQYAAVQYTVDITAELHLPLKYAYWATYCESRNEFVPFMFMTHMNSLVRLANGIVDDKGNGAPSFTGSLSAKHANRWKKANARKPTPLAMARRNLKKEELLKYSPRIKTDPEGYVITANNHIIRIPKEFKMGEYQAAANEWFESLSSEDSMKLALGGREAPKFKFPTSVLYVDHHNEVMVYTTLEGAVTSLSLRGARPLDHVTALKRFPDALRSVINGGAFEWTPERTTKRSAEAKILVNMVTSASGKGGNADLIALGAGMPPEGNPIRAEFEAEDFYKFAHAARGAYQYGSAEMTNVNNLVRLATDNNSEDTDSAEVQLIEILNKGVRDLAIIAKEAWSTGEPRKPNDAVTSNLEADADTYIVAVHGPNLAAYQSRMLAETRNNKVDHLDRSHPIAIPNIDTSRMSFVFPHQGEFIQAIDNDSPPKYAVIGAAPGGGKTLMILADILLLLAKGKIKRPVISVPNALVSQFVREINQFTNGKVNAFPFTYQHVRDVLMNPLGFNMSTPEIVDYLRNLPRNTIIITNYNTLQNGHSDRRDLYSDVGSYDNFGDAKALKAYPFVEILAAAGMDYIAGDESHKIKNTDTGRAQAFLALCAKAEYVRLSSGTTINNIVLDLQGQMQKMNPAILGGSQREFAIDFLGDAGAKQITSPAQSDAIRRAMEDYSLVLQVDSRSWDFMLPKMQEMYHRVPLTPLQNRYYKVVFNKAINLIQEDAKDDLEKVKNDDGEKLNNKIERVVARHFSVVDRFVNDPTQAADFVDGTFVYEEYKIAHDGEEAPEGSLDLVVPEKDDLISVKAKFAYDLMYAHMDERGKLAEIRANKGAARFQPDKGNKVILMAPNIFVGNHVWANMPPDLKKRSVRFQAGAFAKVEQFKTDDSIKFMVADEKSIAEGHNLQVGSRIIRMMQVFTPGDETQSLARIRRPDPFGKYNRDALGYDIIVATQPSGAPTIDDLRIARLLAKRFNNAMVEFNGDASFRNEFLAKIVDKPLPPISMSMDTIKSFPEEMLEQYFQQQLAYNQWFLNSSTEITKRIGREVEALTGQKLLDEYGRPISPTAFTAAVVVPTVEAPEIPGSRSSYVPWLPSVPPINPLNFDMQPIRSEVAKSSDADDEDSDDDREESQEEESPDNVEVQIGDHVMTEFGPGIIASVPTGKVRNGKLTIWIPSMAPTRKGEKYKKVRLAKTVVYVPLDDEGAKILAGAVKGKGGAAMTPPKAKAVTPEQRKEAGERKKGAEKPPVEFTDYEADSEFEEDDFDFDDITIEDDEPEDPIDTLIEEEEEEEEEEPAEDQDEGFAPTLYLQAVSVNGDLAVIADDQATDDGGSTALDSLSSRYGFRKFPDLVRVEFATRKSLDTFLARLTMAKYVIPRNLMAEIELISDGLTSRGKLRQLQPFNFSEVNNFMKTEQRRVPKRPDAKTPQTIRLYPIVMRGKFYLCCSLDKHPFNVNQLLTKLRLGVPGAGAPQVLDNMAVKFYSSMSKAKVEAKKIIADGDLIADEDVQVLLDSFEEIQGGHITLPTAPPPAKVTETKPERPPGATTKPGKKADAKVTTKPQYEEEEYNPLVEDLAEFKTFVQRKRATIAYIKGDNPAIPKNVHMRVVGWDSKTFSLSPNRSSLKSERLVFTYPKGATFNDKKGTMTTSGGGVWLLSCAE